MVYHANIPNLCKWASFTSIPQTCPRSKTFYRTNVHEFTLSHKKAKYSKYQILIKDNLSMHQFKMAPHCRQTILIEWVAAMTRKWADDEMSVLKKKLQLLQPMRNLLT